MSNTKYLSDILKVCSVLPALLVMPAMADVITERQVISENTTYTDLTASDILSNVSNNGGVFYLQDVQDVTLTFDGTTLFSGNSVTGGGMGGAIGNGWLSSIDTDKWPKYTPGGKIFFDGDAVFLANTTNSNNGGGAIFNYGVGTSENPDIVFNGNAQFTGNTVTVNSVSDIVGGGAIHHHGGMIIFNDQASFSENNSVSKGGAILAAGDIIFNDNVEFSGNIAGKNGGALAIVGGDVVFEKSALFDENKAANGSAISMEGSNSSVIFKDSVVFDENTGTAVVWNNNATGTVTFEQGAEFTDNINTANGSLQNVGTVSLTGGNLIFAENVGTNGGGLKNAGTVTVNTAGNVLFDTNITTASGGAIDNGGTIVLNATNVSFLDNVAESGYSGAIFNAGDITITGAENVFSGNIAADTGVVKSGGGAIHNRGNSNTTTLVVGTDDSVNRFTNNVSKAYGGAIVGRAFDGENQDSDITINGTTYFTGNRSALDGGAIWNATAEKNDTIGNAIITFNGNTTFSNNVASGLGGAIYNGENATINMSGVNVFENNIANKVANDIYNDGIFNIAADADVTITGGVLGSGEFNVADGATLNIGASTIMQDTINIGNNTTITASVLSKSAYGRPTYGRFKTTDGDITVGTGTKLFLNVGTVGTYDIFATGGNLNLDIDAGKTYIATEQDNGTIVIKTKDIQDIVTDTGMTEQTAVNVVNLANSVDRNIQRVSLLAQEALNADNIALVEQETAKMNPEEKNVVRSVEMAAQNQALSLASGRMMGGVGRAGGDKSQTNGFWAQGLFNKSKLADKFHGYSRGFAIGADTTIDRKYTLGAGLTYNVSDIHSGSRNTDIDATTLFAYAQYKPSKWFLNGILAYTMSEYDENIDPFGVVINSNYNVNSFGAQFMTGYDFLSGMTPQVGIRYLHVAQDEYNNGINRMNAMDYDYLSGVAGFKYAFEIGSAKTFHVKPELRAMMTYDLVQDNSVATVIMSNINNSYTVDSDNLSRLGGEFGLGMTMTYRGIDISVGYDIVLHEDYTSQTGTLKLRSRF